MNIAHWRLTRFAFNLLTLTLMLTMACGGGEPGPTLAGDIVFQNTNTIPSSSLESATGGDYNNIGLVYQRPDGLQVYEVNRTVHMMPLEEWIAKGSGGKYRVKRLANADEVLTSTTLENMYMIGLEYLSKPCDLTFEWSDDRIYCSELVWKIYQRTIGLEIGERQHLRDFDLTGRLVGPNMEKRFRGNPPLDEWVISPQAIYDSPLLVTVR
jgi:hypothetical protein